MNSHPDPFRTHYPVPSDHLNDQFDALLVDCMELIGVVSPSGTLWYDGLYDRLDAALSSNASGLLNMFTTTTPNTLQLVTEWAHIRQG